jgi:cytochrome c peroxidase
MFCKLCIQQILRRAPSPRSNRLLSSRYAAGIFLLFFLGASFDFRSLAQVLSDEPITPIPLSVELDPRRVALGERLFNDVRLSRDQDRSCSTCHPLSRAGMDGLPVARLIGGAPYPRNTPTVFNVGLNFAYNWDGSANSLTEHADRLLVNPNVMNMVWPELITRLRAEDSYVSQFHAAYPDGLTRGNAVDAIAAFERSLITPNSRFDRYLRGERQALTDRERQGYRLFKAYGCVSCHQGVNVGGNLYQKFGMFEDTTRTKRGDMDPGRIRVTNVSRDRRVFRVPSLRNVAETAPYFHDGREANLENAIEIMAKAQLRASLTREEISRIADFLRTLTGEYRGNLVQSRQAELR